ncbi:MAG TPA: hypothetical protein VMT20_27305 [Terriglobia bacterium]|nr:hypothetical protein [Terriglobia bacterium]
MPDQKQDERLFSQLAERTGLDSRQALPAPSRLKAKIYSALMLRESASKRLRSIPETKAEGGKLCVFEELVRIAPVSTKMKSLNICRVCHARVLGESMEKPPIYWANCPYVEFKKS